MMIRSFPTLTPRSRFFSTTLALVITMVCGIVEGGQSDEKNSLVLPTNQWPQIDLNAVFTDSDSHSTSNGLKFSMLRLVSQETPPSIPVTSSDGQNPAMPIYTMQEPAFQEADGNAFAGPNCTRGTWVLLAPYVWIAGVNGQIGAGGRSVGVDVTPGQVMSNIGKLDGALMLHSEVGKGDWGLILDVNLVRAGTSVLTPPAQIDVTLQQTLIEVLGMYRFVDMPGYLVESKSLSVDFLAGGRFYEFGNALTVRPFDPTLPTVPFNVTGTWVDMVVGGRAVIPVTNTIDVFGRGDIGGFGIGDSSTLAWNLIAGLDWKLTSNSSLVAGYRELNINRSSSVAGTAFQFDAKLYGPFMALTLQF